MQGVAGSQPKADPPLAENPAVPTKSRTAQVRLFIFYAIQNSGVPLSFYSSGILDPTYNLTPTASQSR
ncbi:MAG: hypothetical protein HY964_08970 [Ignavibacteriales bacterium]|nr:hypothetical protein [Ignavibacteriales bacterium]